MIPGLDLQRDPRVKELEIYLTHEYRTTRDLRRALEERWLMYLIAYRAPVPTTIKKFPFLNAANLTIPIIGMQVEQVYSRLMSMIFGPESLWTAKAIHPDYVDIAPKITEFLTWSQKNELMAYDPIADWMLELCKLGTSVLKTRYKREWKTVYEYREAQTMNPEEINSSGNKRQVLLCNAPTMEHVPLWDFFVPPNAINIKDAAWCGHRFKLTKEQYYNRVRMGLYMFDQQVEASFNEYPNHIVSTLQDMDMFNEWQGVESEFIEFWLDYDITGTGEPCAIMCVLHEATQRIIRVDYNPYINQEKPFDAARFMRVEKRFYGIGMAEMLYMFQSEISTMHNQRIDSGTVNTMPIFKALRTGPIKQNEPLFPGRVVHVDDMVDFAPVQFANQIDSTIDNEELLRRYATDRTGANDYVMGGDAPSVGYSTAFTAANQAREGAKRFDQTLREVRSALSNCGTRIFELYQQYNQGGKVYYVSGQQDGELVERVLKMPMDLARKGLFIDVTATSAAYNKEVELRSQTIVLQELTRYYQQLLQYVQIAINPQAPPQIRLVAERSAIGLGIVVRRILDLHGMQDVDRVAINPAEVVGNGSGNGLPQPNGGAAPLDPRLGGASGMGAIPGGTPAEMALGGNGVAGLLLSGGAVPSAGQDGRNPFLY